MPKYEVEVTGSRFVSFYVEVDAEDESDAMEMGLNIALYADDNDPRWDNGSIYHDTLFADFAEELA